MIKHQYLVDTKTDALIVLSSVDEVWKYLDENNIPDAKAIWETENKFRTRIRIETWEKEQNRYRKTKAEWCKIHGTE